MSGNLQIRAATAAEMSLFADWVGGEGWNPGVFDGGCYRVADDGGFLIGALGGEDVALVSAVRYGKDGNTGKDNKDGADNALSGGGVMVLVIR